MMHEKITEIAERIKGMRLLLDLSPEDMAAVVDMTADEYLEYESGKRDFSFTFLYLVAGKMGVDMSEFLTGTGPKLTTFSLIHKGEGFPITRRSGFNYLHLAYPFKDKIGEPFFVTAQYSAEAQTQPIVLSHHEGQEFDYILSGNLKIKIGTHEMALTEGDAIYYDSSIPHGMIATDGQNCTFLAMVMKA